MLSQTIYQWPTDVELRVRVSVYELYEYKYSYVYSVCVQVYLNQWNDIGNFGHWFFDNRLGDAGLDDTHQFVFVLLCFVAIIVIIIFLFVIDRGVDYLSRCNTL